MIVKWAGVGLLKPLEKEIRLSLNSCIIVAVETVQSGVKFNASTLLNFNLRALVTFRGLMLRRVMTADLLLRLL